MKKTENNFLRRNKELLLGTTRRKVLSGIGIAGILFLIWRLFGGSSAKLQYQTANVVRGSIISTVSESGNITSSSEASVGSPTTGIVDEIYVKDGDTVTQGQKLFKVRSTATAQEVASAYATYEAAIATANTAAQNKITAQATLEKDRGAVITASAGVTTMQNNINVSQPNPATKLPYTQDDIDAINSALTQARETFSADELKYKEIDQTIVSANAALNSSQLAYNATQDSEVTAPVGGTVVNITVFPGDQINATSGSLTSNASTSSTSTGANAVLSIGDFSKPYIKVQASEIDTPSLKVGQKAIVTLDAFPNKTFAGQVAQIDSVGTISSGVVTYNVFIVLISPPSELLPGMTAAATIETERKDNVLTVPSTAVQTRNGTQTVRILKNGIVTSVDVTTGISSDTDTEITSGLSEGDTVVTGTLSPAASTGGTASPFGRGFGGFGGGGRGRGG